MDVDSTTLRKRSGRVRDKSIGPESRSRPPPPAKDTDPGWEELKERLRERFPAIDFPDEYYDEDVVTSSIFGVGDDVYLVGKFLMDEYGIPLRLQDGGVVVEYKIGTKPKRVEGSNIVKSKTFWFFVIWVISLLIFIRFVTQNHGKYMKLLWSR